MEKLGDFLPSYRRGMLERIMLSQQLSEQVSKLVPGELKVVVGQKSIQLICYGPNMAKRLNLERAKIGAMVKKLLGPQARHYQLKIRSR